MRQCSLRPSREQVGAARVMLLESLSAPQATHRSISSSQMRSTSFTTSRALEHEMALQPHGVFGLDSGKRIGMAKHTEKEPPAVKGVSAAERALVVLSAFRRGDGALSLAELAERT